MKQKFKKENLKKKKRNGFKITFKIKIKPAKSLKLLLVDMKTNSSILLRLLNFIAGTSLFNRGLNRYYTKHHYSFTVRYTLTI